MNDVNAQMKIEDENKENNINLQNSNENNKQKHANNSVGCVPRGRGSRPPLIQE